MKQVTYPATYLTSDQTTESGEKGVISNFTPVSYMFEASNVASYIFDIQLYYKKW